jgi:hypothetical protein
MSVQPPKNIPAPVRQRLLNVAKNEGEAEPQAGRNL